MKKKTELKRAIKALGTSANKIAQTLHANGIKGVRLSSNCCPIANYIKPFCPKDDVMVVYETIYINRYETNAFVLLSTKAMKVFINRFDRGQYPSLIV